MSPVNGEQAMTRKLLLKAGTEANVSIGGFQGMINSTREILELDFDLFVGGHADVGDKLDVHEFLAYLEALYSAVVDGIHRGSSLEDMQTEIRLDKYKHFTNYEQWLPLNIEGVYERLMEESGMGWRSDLSQ